ncbi:hypothetical protein VD0002_g10256 [Verticillium dahliae]|nr:hypothetical protein VD0002_g10256 [Verticillium dahliae]
MTTMLLLRLVAPGLPGACYLWSLCRNFRKVIIRGYQQTYD